MLARGLYGRERGKRVHAKKGLGGEKIPSKTDKTAQDSDKKPSVLL
jgi:hypothetical protein